MRKPLALCAVLALTLALTPGGVATAATAGQPLVFHEITPCALFDTRPSQGGTGIMAAGESRTFHVVGSTSDFAGQGGVAGGCGIPGFSGGVPQAQMVYLNLVAVDPVQGGNLKVWATTDPEPAGGVVNYQKLTPNLNNSNSIVVGVRQDTEGSDLTVKANVGSVHVRGVALGYLTIASNSFWALGGNAGTTGSHFVGTTDNQPLNFRVNDARAFRLEPGTSPNVIGGFSGNNATAGVVGATIGGGGASPETNLVTDNYGTIGGGVDNQAGDAAGTTADKFYATVGGGQSNVASGAFATVGGGTSNTAGGNWATVAGGASNTASGDFATVGGGDRSTAQGNNSFAVGTRAQANHHGSFVWADSTEADFASMLVNEFAVRAGGGVRFEVGSDTCSLSAGTGAWTGSCAPPAADPAWLLGGNSGTDPSTDFVGTTDNTALNFRVNDQRILRLEPGDPPNIIGGVSTNSIAAGVKGATISGGGSFGQPNTVIDHNGTIGGGQLNTAGNGAGTLVDAEYATVGGGFGNTASGVRSTIAGGGFNEVTDDDGTIGGGQDNQAGNAAGSTTDRPFATVGGGKTNTASGEGATVAGGTNNLASGFKATVGGGDSNQATGANGPTVGGGKTNTASGEGATVAGGTNNVASGFKATVGGGDSNQATGVGESTVGGGQGNGASARYATVGGGHVNVANSFNATVGGGECNTASGRFATVGGGGELVPFTGCVGNTASGEFATVGGGKANQATAGWATVGGGFQNVASGVSATVPGGGSNVASGQHSLAAGREAVADDAGAFVWADDTAGAVTSPGANTFTVQASGGTTIYSNAALTTGVTLAAGGGSWGSVSDRAVKANLRAVSPGDILARVAELPIATWRYRGQDPSIRHIGPMAQDFHAAFGVGEDERYITTIDADGVALAAIQGLNEKLESRLAAVEGRGSAPSELPAAAWWAMSTAIGLLGLGLGRRWGGGGVQAVMR